MTRWGLLLLVTFIGLGLSPLPARTAARIACTVTALVIAGVFVKYGAL